MLLDAAERALRAPRGKLAIALHLSRLKNPSPRPYHTRIAMALMQDTAQLLGGQVFPMRNADLVLLCAAPAQDVSGLPAAAAFTLPGLLERLFGADAPGAALTSLWRLDETPDAFRDYIAQRQAEPEGRPPAHDQAGAPRGLETLATHLAATAITQLLHQQTAVELHPGRTLPVAARLTPLFREFLVTTAGMVGPAAPVGGGHHAATDAAPADALLLADPFLLRHLAPALEARIMAHVMHDMAAAGPLTRPAVLRGLPLHLNLTPDSIVSPAFARLAATATARGIRLAVEMSAMDAGADPELAAFARTLLRQADVMLILDGVDHAALIMTDAAFLAPTLVKIFWSPRMADGPAPLLARIEAAVASIGPGRIVLCGADGEAALLWGQARGITRFQGTYMDAVQAASRIAVCHSARTCTLRQCTARAVSLDPLFRTGCGNPGLLDVSPAAPPS